MKRISKPNSLKEEMYDNGAKNYTPNIDNLEVFHKHQTTGYEFC